MAKFYSIFVATLFGLVCATGCNHAPAKNAPELKLSNSFATSALLALKGIEGDVSTPEVRDAKILVDQHTKDQINAADAQGTTSEEKAVADTLNHLLLSKLANNAHRNNLILLFKANYEYSVAQKRYERLDEIRMFTPGRDEKRARINAEADALLARESFETAKFIEHNPEIIAMDQDEAACFTALDEMLRKRSTNLPMTSCSKMTEIK